MARYPVKLLKDEGGQPFVPLTHMSAVSGEEYALASLTAQKTLNGHFQIIQDELSMSDLSQKMITVQLPTIEETTITSYLKLNNETEYPIMTADGDGPLLMSDYSDKTIFLSFVSNQWRIVAIATTGHSGHTISDGNGELLPSRAILRFEGMEVSDGAGIGATIIKTAPPINNLSTTESGVGTLDAYQGKVLNDKFNDYATIEYVDEESTNNIEVSIGEEEPTGNQVLWIDESIVTPTKLPTSQVVNNLAGNETDMAPSVLAVNSKLNNYLPLHGNADSATKALEDGDGNIISANYTKTFTPNINTSFDSTNAGDILHRSFMGTIHDGTHWYNLISSRHRNGEEDGNKYGMQLRSYLNHGSLEYRNQYAGAWSDWRTVLDTESNAYSTYEIRIGRWVDGKPLYRRYVEGSVTGLGVGESGYTDLVDLNSWNIEECVFIEGTIKNAGGDLRVVPVNSYENASYNICFSYLGQTGYLQFKSVGWNQVNGSWNFVYRIVLEYTKTTD